MGPGGDVAQSFAPHRVGTVEQAVVAQDEGVGVVQNEDHSGEDVRQVDSTPQAGHSNDDLATEMGSDAASEVTTTAAEPDEPQADSTVGEPALAGETERSSPRASVAVGTHIGEYVIEQVVRDDPRGSAYVARAAEETASESAPPWERYLLLGQAPGAYVGTGDLISLRLQHARLLAPRGLISTEGADYLVLESLPVTDQLPRRVSDGARLSVIDALRAGAGLGDALSYLHRNDVAHLHVSPDTIWLLGGRAYLSGIEEATRLNGESDEGPALYARDANFLARTLAFLTVPAEDSPESPSGPYDMLRNIVDRGESGAFTTPEEVAAACARAVQASARVLPASEASEDHVRVRYSIGRATTVGRVRTENQDAIGTMLFDIRDDLIGDMPVGVFLVADGMGGEAHGEVASRIGARITLAEMARIFASPWIAQPATAAPDETAVAAFAELTGMTLGQVLAKAVTAANQQVRSLAQQIGQSTGSTLTAIAVAGPQAGIAHIGDSRAYLLHEGSLIQLTEDHSLLARLQAMDHPLLNDPAFAVPRNFLYRSLGQEEETPPDTLEFTLTPGDRLLLCSDGLWDELDDPTICQALAEAENPQLCAERLVALANATGGHDNSTAVVVFVAEDPHDADEQRADAEAEDALSAGESD